MRTRLRSGIALACGLALTAAASGQDGAPHRVTTIDGETLTGKVVTVVDDVLTIEALDGSSRTIALDQLDVIQNLVANEAAPSGESTGHAWLRSGGSGFDAAVRRGDGASLRFATGDGAEMEFQIAHLRAVRFEGADRAPNDAFDDALAEPPDTRDYLFARDSSGEIRRLSVRVGGAAEDSLSVEFGGRERSVPFARVHGIVFGTETGAAPTPLPKPTAQVEVGERPTWSGKLASWRDGRIELRLAEGPTVTLSADAVPVLRVRSGRIAWLSSLEPTGVDQTPAFDRVRPWMRDAAPRGPGLELDGRRYDRGICLVPRTRLSFALTAGEFDTFEALVGIDDRASDQAHATIRVLVDDEIAVELDSVTRGSRPRPIRVEIAGATKLTIEADFGKNFDLGDHCVFAAARLLKN